MDRRSFLIKGSLFIASAAGLQACSLFPSAGRPTTGSVVGSNWKAGHLMLQGPHESPAETIRTGIVIVGGGIAGLSAAGELKKRRYEDFLLLELEGHAGGNAASGANAASHYPWGAHYIPIPGEEAVFVRELFEELGIIEGYDAKGLPIYNEYYLCADPHERLFIHGHWQDGLVPHFGVGSEDRRQIETFFDTMKRFKEARGSDGRRAFAIPIEGSSRDPQFRKFDAITMARYLDDNGWNSPYLKWYVNYCCRDDYGCRSDETSAWAGLHYFASRDGTAANADTHALVTWPSGIGWVVERMAAKVGPALRLNACVVDIAPRGSGVDVDYWDTLRQRMVRVHAGAVIYAGHRFTALKTIAPLRERRPSYADSFSYAPWMVANVTLKEPPEGKGAALSWDNVSYHSESLGYVVANHQDLRSHPGRTVVTYYYPLTFGDAASQRQIALKRTHAEWVDIIIKDLSRMHQNIAKDVEQIDVWLWGHAMQRPVPGFIWGQARQDALKPLGRIHFAHSDMSGISIFEEAQYRGIMAARAALGDIKA